MRSISNTCGAKNSFGYYDSKAREIILRHPYTKKRDIEEAYLWLEDAHDLKKFGIGIGTVENFVVKDNGDTLYSTARNVIKQTVKQAQTVDNEILKNILTRLKGKKLMRNMGIKGYIFEKDIALFELLVQTIRSLKSLIYLDMNGCYFNEEQLVTLADVIGQSHIAHLIWPEARLPENTTRAVLKKLENNRSLTVMRGVPSELQEVARRNRAWLFGMAKQPSSITDEEKAIIVKYADSCRLGLAYEKQRFFDIEKAVEAVLA